jgi:hypothetical protein
VDPAEEEEEQAATPAPSTIAAADIAAILRRMAHGRDDRGVELLSTALPLLVSELRAETACRRQHRHEHQSPGSAIESIRGIDSDDCKPT